MKYIGIIIMFTVGLIGCDSNEFKTTDGYRVGHIYKLDFEGHTYLIRTDYNRGGMCHDENCKCKKD